MCYPTPVSTRATYFQAAFDAGVVDNSRMGLLLTEGASAVQGFTGALCIHLLEYILYCHGVSSSFFADVLAELLTQGWFGSGVDMADARSQKQKPRSRFVYSSTDQSAHGTDYPERITHSTWRSAEQS